MHMFMAALGRPLIQVTFGAAGAGAAHDTSSPLAVPYPADIVVGNFLLLHVKASDIGGPTITTPADWTLIDSNADFGATRSSIYWKRARSAESGSLDVTFSGSNAFGRMYRFSHGIGVAAAASASDITADTTIDAVDVTTSVAKAMAVQCIWHNVSTTIGAISSESGADYTEAAAEFNDASSGTLSCQVAEMATAGAITGGAATAGASGTHIVHGFAIRP